MGDFDQNPELRPFAETMGAFLDGTIDADGFAQRYRLLFESDTVHFSGAATRVLNALYRTVDAFAGRGDVSDVDLADVVRRALAQLRDLDAQTSAGQR